MNKLVTNVLYLSLVKGIDFILPLVLIPIVIKSVGVNNYGIFSISLVYFNFLISLVDFGHSIIAIKEIAIIKSIKKQSKIINETISFKIILSLICFFVWNGISLLNDDGNHTVVFIFSIALFFESCSLFFFFQAKEDIKIVVTIQFFTRLISSVLVIAVMSVSDSLIFYSALHVLPNIINPILLYLIFKNRYNQNKWYLFKFKTSLRRVKKAWEIYSYQMINGLTLPIVNTFILSVYGLNNVAIFSICQRILSSLYRLFEPIIIAVYPHMNKLYMEKTNRFNRFSLLLLSIVTIACIVIVVSVNIYSNEIQVYITNESFSIENSIFYKNMTFLLFPMVLNLFLTRMLVVVDLAKANKYILLFSTLIMLALLVVVYFLNIKFMVISWVLLCSYFIITLPALVILLKRLL